MSTFAEAQERAEELAKELRSAGMKGIPYKRAPIATEIASLSIEGGGTGVRVWPGMAEVTVISDRKRKQAVLRLKEGAREITRTYPVRGKWYDGKEVPDKEMRADARSTFPVFVPKMTFKEVKLGEFIKKNSYDRNVTVTVIAPATSQTFLIGIDESSHFISPLKHHVSSVEAAHELLRPSGVPKDALRQGEWFFVPVTPRELAAINKRLENARYDGWNPNASGYAVQPLEEGSSHQAPVCRIGTKRYACGAVTDMRLRRHSPLVLNGWHRIVRNTELTNPVQQQMSQRFNYD